MAVCRGADHRLVAVPTIGWSRRRPAIGWVPAIGWKAERLWPTGAERLWPTGAERLRPTGTERTRPPGGRCQSGEGSAVGEGRYRAGPMSRGGLGMQPRAFLRLHAPVSKA